jgi:hypothetical protein
MPGVGQAPRDPWPCIDCGHLMVGKGMYKRRRGEGFRVHGGFGRCNACFARARRAAENQGLGYRAGQCANFAELVEDIEWILGTDSVERISARVGYPRVASLVRRLERGGRPDLARIFDRSDERMSA